MAHAASQNALDQFQQALSKAQEYPENLTGRQNSSATLKSYRERLVRASNLLLPSEVDTELKFRDFYVGAQSECVISGLKHLLTAVQNFIGRRCRVCTC